MGLTFVITACSYNFSDDNFVDLALPSQEGISISLQNFKASDTINVDRVINYSINAGDDQFGIVTDIFVDAQRVGSGQRTNTGQFTIRPSLYEDGERMLRIVHELNSGTGSLKEQQGQETITFIEEFPFYINRKPSNPPNINSAIIEDGSITVRWDNADNQEFIDAFLHLQFPAYERLIPLTRETFEAGVFIDTNTVLFPLDGNRPESQNRNSVTYSLLLRSEFEEIKSEGVTLESNPDWLKVAISFVDFESYAVTWPEHPLYNNFDSYEITLSYSYFYDPVSITASTRGGTQEVNEPYTFGADYFGNLIPNTNPDFYVSAYRFNPILDEITLKPIPIIIRHSVRELLFNPDTLKYYLLAVESGNNNSEIVTLSEYSTTMELVRKIELFEIDAFSIISDLNLVIDPDTNNFYLDFGYRNRDFELIRQTMELDKFNLDEVREFNTQGLAGRNTYQLRGNILKTWDFQTKRLSLTNISTGEVFYEVTLENNNSANQSFISNNGKYLLIKGASSDTIYQISNNTVTETIALTTRVYGFALDIKDDVLYYAAVGNTIMVIDLRTNQVLSNIAYESGDNGRSISYDPISNNILLLQRGDCFILNQNSGELSKFKYEETKGNEGYGDGYTMWLTNSRLIHSKGIYVDIE